MSEETEIAWTDSTLNFWSGCSKVSAGCAHCYAESLSDRGMGNIGKWGKGAQRQLHESAFKLAVKLNKKPWIADDDGKAYGPSIVVYNPHEKFHPRRIFSLSLGDWLDPEVPVEWLARMLDTIRQCNQVTWQLLTKRPELWRDRIELIHDIEQAAPDREFGSWLYRWLFVQPPENIWIGTSVENQETMVQRVPYLLGIPAAKHFVSAEPLLGPLELNYNFWLDGRGRREDKTLTEPGFHKHIDWVIAGGESGRNARPCNVQWLIDIKDQCEAAGVPCFVKQLGSNAVNYPGPHRWICKHPKGGDPAEWPEDLRVQEFPQ